MQLCSDNGGLSADVTVIWATQMVIGTTSAYAYIVVPEFMTSLLVSVGTFL
jgi:hypothetical protein